MAWNARPTRGRPPHDRAGRKHESGTWFRRITASTSLAVTLSVTIGLCAYLNANAPII